MNPKRKPKYGTLSVLVIIIIAMAMIPSIALAVPADDIKSHWAKVQIEDWIGKGLVSGYPDGTFKPDNNISRAELMAMVNKAFGYSDRISLDYKDVAADVWYADAVAKAAAAGYIGGYTDGTVKPEALISRQETAVVIMKVRHLTASATAADKFTDEGSIPVWSKGAVGAVVSAGIMGGYPDKTFRPGNPISRAEAVIALSKALGYVAPTAQTNNSKIYDKAGTYGPATGTETIKGEVTIKAKDVTLQNILIEGNLTIDKAVADGSATLKKVVVKGTTYIYGGGANSVYLIDTQTGKTYVMKDDGPVRIVASGTSEINELVAQSSVKVEELDLTGKGFEGITVDKKADGKIEINLVNARVENFEVKSEGVTINTDRNTHIATLVVNAGIAITGTGTVETANINASGVIFETRPATQTVASGVSAPTIMSSNTSSDGGRGGGGGPNIVLVNSITVTGTGNVSTINTTGGTLQMATAVTPTNATNTSVTWSVTNGTGSATINTNGLLTAVKNGKVIVKATANDGSGKYGEKEIAISGQAGAIISTTSAIANGAVNPTVVVTLENDSFTADEISTLAGSWIGSVGTTGLMGGTITRNNDRQITFYMKGTAKAGTLSLQANAAALTGGAASNTITITVPADEPVTVSAVAVKTPPVKIAYNDGDTLDLTGLMVTLTRSNNTSQEVARADFAAQGISTSPLNGAALTASDSLVTITVNGKTAVQAITVNPITVSSVAVKTAPVKVAYTEGDTLDLTGLTVTLTKSNNSSEEVALADFAAQGITTSPLNGAALTASDTLITITVNGETAVQAITVSPITVSAVAVKTPPVKIAYNDGDVLDLTGLAVTLTRSNNTSQEVALADFAAQGITTSPLNGAALTTSDALVTITVNGKTAVQAITVNQVITPPAGDLLDANAGGNFTGVLYTRNGSIYYNQADSNGKWQSETLLGTGTEGRMAIDGTGNPHVAYTTAGKIAYRKYDGSAWTDEVCLESNNGGTCCKPDIAVDGSGKAHIVYKDTLGNVGYYTDTPDIMYATNVSGNFVKTLVYSGFYDYYGNASGRGEYYDKDSFLTLNSNGDYFRATHQRVYDKYMGGQDTTYNLVVNSNLGEGNISNYKYDIFDIYDLTSNGNKVVVLYKQTGFKTSELTGSGTAINFTNTTELAGSSVSSVATDGTNVVVGGTNGSNLQTHYNGASKVYDNITVEGTKVSVVNLDGTFYAVYRDNADHLIKMRAIEVPANYAVTVATPAGGTAAVTVDKATAHAGETVTVTIADIESGKQFKSIMVMDADSGAVAATEVIAGASYSFTMPAKAVTVTVAIESSSVPVSTISGADVTITPGSIVFSYTLAGSEGPVTYAQAKAAPYYLDIQASTIVLSNGSNSSPSTFADLGIQDDGKVSYTDLQQLKTKFSGLGFVPDRIIINLTGASTVNSGKDQWSYNVTVNLEAQEIALLTPPSSDATLKATSMVKGVTIASLGTPNSNPADAAAGAVTITEAQAADTSNAGGFVTLFEPTDPGTAVKAVKYAMAGNPANFQTDVPYNNETITNQDFFVIQVSAQDGSMIFYRVVVTVLDQTPPCVIKLGDGLTDFTIDPEKPNAYGELIFSEEINETSKTAVENAVQAGITGINGIAGMTFSWPDEKTFRFNVTGWSKTWDADVISDITDLAGNTASGLLLIDSAE